MFLSLVPAWISQSPKAEGGTGACARSGSITTIAAVSSVVSGRGIAISGRGIAISVICTRRVARA